MFMKIGIGSAIFALLTSALVAPSVRAEEQTTEEAASVLFTFDGHEAELRSVGDDRGSFELVMPLRTPQHLVTWFTDRPRRDAGTISMRKFVSLWANGRANGFAFDPPNVALDFGNNVLIATMTRPRITTIGTGTKVLKARLTPLEDSALDVMLEGPSVISAHAQRKPARPIGSRHSIPRISAFIDSGKITYYYTEWDNEQGSPKGSVKATG